MKGLYKRIISGVLVLVTIFLTCFPVAFASSEGSLDSYKPTTLWDWAKSEDNLGWNFLKSLFDKDVCPKSPNTNGLHEFVKATTTIDGKTGLYYVCKHCGKSAGEVGEGAYQQQVSTLPATGFTSDGHLLWQVSFEDCNKAKSHLNTYKNSNGCYFSELPCASSVVSSIYTWVSYLSDRKAILFEVRNWEYSSPCLYVYFNAPISGSYCRISSPAYSVAGTFSSGASISQNDNYVKNSSFSFYSLGSEVSSSTPMFRCSDVSSGFAYFYFPIYEIIPAAAPSGDTYNINTRPTTITGGNYGIVGDDNNITTVTNTTQIVNEGNNLYYNPATGQTQTITDWTYNYDGRIYNITLDTGDTVSVEYGDENITITENTVNEGDTIVNNYTIYYMIDGSGESHTHEWYKTGERQATCLVPAQRTYTCSICGEQKTETDPVLGHSWHAIQTVTTQYDEKGIQTQEGYTIYECERCGEQYKSTNNTGPPATGGGGSGGGTSENIFTGIFGLIWDFFTFLFDLFSEFVVGGIKGFISGLKDAGSSFFSILNPFDWGY